MRETCAGARRRDLGVVCAVIGARFVLAGLFWLAFRRDLRVWSLASVILAFGTDVLDGRLSRRYHVSAIGGYLDAIADFFFVLVAFSCFISAKLYPWWILALIGAMFAQFMATSGLREPIYDPVGKYYGVYLYFSAGLTVLWSRPFVYTAILVGLVCLTVAALTSRIVHLYRHRRSHSNPT
jgi:CDP-diacylglycerol---glycerol-3-phosphate 3-phosphatidyltransferase